jgi:four helix bundle protein
MDFLFERLKVYQMAVNLAEELDQLAAEIRKRGNYPLADQIRRAAISIPANIAEGNGRHHPADRRKFLFIARGSGFELVPLLELSVRGNFIDDKGRMLLIGKLRSICKILSAMTRS